MTIQPSQPNTVTVRPGRALICFCTAMSSFSGIVAGAMSVGGDSTEVQMLG